MAGKKRARIRLYFTHNSWVLAISSAIWSIGGSLANPYQSVFFYAVGAPLFYIGALAAVSSIVTVMALVVGGYVADAWGRRKVIAVFSIISAANAFIYIFINNWPLLFMPIIIGALSGIYTPAFNATLNDSMEPRLRPIGFASFAILTTIPSVFSPYLGSLLITSYGSVAGLKMAFFVTGLLGVIATVWRARRLEETRKIRDHSRPGFADFVKEVVKSNFLALQKASSDAKKLILYSITSSIATSLSTIFISLYLINTVKILPTQYGLLVGLGSFATILILLPAVGIIKRVGLKKAAILSALFAPLSMLVFVSSNGMNDLIAWSVTGGVGGALIGPVIQSLQGNTTRREIRGRLMAIFTLVPLLIAVPAQLLSGYLYANIDPIATFILSIPFYAISVLILATLRVER